MPALNAYADTARPNWAGFRLNDFISISPNGDMTIKSSITENWVTAKMNMANF